MLLVSYLTNRTGTVQFQGQKSKVNHLTNGTPQGSSLSPTLFNMVINQLLQLNLGSKVQMIAYANDLAIHGGPIGHEKLYKQMTTALKMIKTKAMQLSSPLTNVSHDGIEATIQTGISRSLEKIFHGSISEIPWGHHRQKTKLQETSRLHKTNTDRKMNLLKVLNSPSDVNASILKNIYTATMQATLEYGAVTFGMMAPSNIDRLQVSQNQGMRLILGVPRGTSAMMMRHELQMLPVEQRAKLSRAKLYRKIRGNTKHPLHATINRRQRNGWTTEI